jgi:hypothetical protein
MKTLETDALLPEWLNGVLNRWPLCIHKDAVATIFTIAYDAEGWYRPENKSQFYNGYFFVRITWPGGIWIHVKPRIDSRYQVGIGFKNNGRFGIPIRLGQTDAAAAAGVQGPNTGQAAGWERGTA